MWALVGTYIAIAIVGLATMMIFLDKLPADLRDPMDKSQLGSQTLQRIKSTILQLKSKKQLLLLPLTIYSGLEQSYYNADFTNVSRIQDSIQNAGRVVF